ncbi:MAG: glycine--tRNA ligase subunit beta [Elusimicrobiales bacterium]|nr:glycine--tRNA ligase subunit beta [Elusimicrobiales bacterium]
MSNALLEIGVEHLPARFVKSALSQLEENARKLLAEKRIGFSGLRAAGTHRRLALIIEGLETASPDMETESLGPAASKWKTADGKYTPQSTGFAAKHGLTPDKLYIADSAKGAVLAAKKIIKGEPANDILAAVFPKLVSSLQFPKTMTWEETQFRFARPIRGFLALNGDRNVPFELAGVKSGKKTAARQMTGSKPVSVSSAEEYIGALRGEGVLAEPEDRRKALVSAVASAAARLGAKPALDEALLEETVYLAENPVAVTGGLSLRFMKLPPELIITVLKRQLKFFPVLNAQDELEPHFIAVRDGTSENQDEVRQGFESVVEARLSDAVFFFEKDLAHSLDDMRGRLNGVLFHEKLGSMYLKSARVEHIAKWICERIRQDMHVDEAVVSRASQLAYADLTSEVVREFPELQGHMGGEYAARAGESPRAALAIKEFYFPLTAKSGLPATPEGAIVSLAGKIDTLVGDFAVDMVPTGSEDPHALRRLAAGAVRILMEKGLPLSVSELAGCAYDSLPPDFKSGDVTRRINILRRDDCAPENACANPLDKDRVTRGVEEFVWSRAETILAEKGFGFDTVRAVRKAQFDGGRLARPLSLSEIFARAAALHNVRKNPDFAAVAVSYKRVANILRKAAEDKVEIAAEISEAAFAAKQEGELYCALKTVRARVFPFLSHLRAAQPDYESCLLEMASLKPQLDSFFDAVMVMDPAPEIRANRLALLKELHVLLGSVADLSQLQ